LGKHKGLLLIILITLQCCGNPPGGDGQGTGIPFTIIPSDVSELRDSRFDGWQFPDRILFKNCYRATVMQMKFIAMELEDYHKRNGTFPSNKKELEELNKRRRGKLSDGWKNPFKYRYINKNSCEIKSFGFDRREGGTGIDSDITGVFR